MCIMCTTIHRHIYNNLTLNCAQGYEKRWTFPKSSPVTRRFLSLDLQTALMSVPSEPSGHRPVGGDSTHDEQTWKHEHKPRGGGEDHYLPKTWKPRVQVYVAHSISLVVSTLTTCLHTDGIPAWTQIRSITFHSSLPTLHLLFWWETPILLFFYLNFVLYQILRQFSG